MLSQAYMMVKAWMKKNEADIFALCMIVLSVVLVGGLIRVVLVWQGHEEVTVTGTEWGSVQPLSAEASRVAASKNGTRYYYPWCGGISRIKEANKIWFSSAGAAEAAGYTLASGCEGL